MANFHSLRSRHDDANCTVSYPEWDQYNQLAEQLAASQPTARMPSLAHLNFRDYECVYEPSHDTYLLLDALLFDVQQRQHERYRMMKDNSCKELIVCLELGCGTGVPSVFCRTLWYELCSSGGGSSDSGKSNSSSSNNDKNCCGRTTTTTTTTTSTNVQIPFLSIVTDVNPRALRVTRQTFAQAAQNAKNPALAYHQAIQCDLASVLLPQLQHSVSLLLWNPPYVPTPDEDVGCTNNIEAAWAGGALGRRVIDRGLPQLAALLDKIDGVAYLVTVDENRPYEIAHECNKLGLCMRPLFRRRSYNEYLTVQKITWIKDNNNQS